MEDYLVKMPNGIVIEVSLDDDSLCYYEDLKDVLLVYPDAVAVKAKGQQYWLSREHVFNAE